jgi:hypothetical protein
VGAFPFATTISCSFVICDHRTRQSCDPQNPVAAKPACYGRPFEELRIGMAEDRYIVIKEEGWVASAISDVATLGTLCLAFWFNHTYAGDSYLFDAVIVVGLITAAMKINPKKTLFKTAGEAIQYIQELDRA